MDFVLQNHTSYSSTITLNRPDKRNAFNAQMIAELTKAMKQASERTANKYVLIRANGKAFSAGADLNYMKSMATFSQVENEEDSKQLYDLFDAIYQCPIPTICIVQGASFGGSNGIIAACDKAFAHSETKFAFSEVKLGLLPATISPFVIEKIGSTAALDLFTTGRLFTAEEAKEVGLVQVIANEREELESKCEAFLENYKHVAPQAMRNSKKLVREIQKPTNETRDATAKRIANARISTEGQEGISAFFEKRKPEW